MKTSANKWLAILGLLGLTWQLEAITSDPSGNPYSVVTNRNLFDLKPIPKPEDIVQPPPPAPPTKITLQGIQELWGKREVLLKIPEPPAAGQPPKELSLIMTEGERRGTLEVVRIDMDTREVEFRDSGTPVTLNLTNFIAKTVAPTPAAPGKPGVVPGVPRPVGIPTPSAPGVPVPRVVPTSATAVPNFRGSAQTSPNFPTRPLRTGGIGATTLPSFPGSVASTPTPTPTPQVQLTPEEQIIMMEVERERNKAIPGMPPLPPTPLTPAESMPPMVPPTPPPLPGQ